MIQQAESKYYRNERRRNLYFYTGKSMDGFENAMNMLFINNGYEEVKHLDCISMRNCAMSNAGAMSQWFSPMTSTIESIGHISQALGALDLFEVREIREIDKGSILQPQNKPFILGPINKKRFFNKIDANFYDGNRNYVYCFSVEGKLIVHEPDGVPCVTVDEKDIENFMRGKNMLYQIFINPNKTLKKPNRKEILQKWASCKSIYANSPEEIANYNYSSIKDLSASNELELKYGLQNYMIQIYKMIHMVLQGITEDKQYSKLFEKYAEEIAVISIKKEFNKLANVIKKINELLMQIIMEEINK
jgi:hypothetical protein